jgi:predicted nuclease with TOPRIM domain
MSDDLGDSLKSMSDAELRRLCRSLEGEAKRLQAENERLRKKTARLERRRDDLREAVARIGGETQAPVER